MTMVARLGDPVRALQSAQYERARGDGSSVYCLVIVTDQAQLDEALRYYRPADTR